MNKNQKQNFVRLIARLAHLGLTYDETATLIRIERILHLWAERECNGEIERDEQTGKPFRVWHGLGKAGRHAIPDLEAGALRRLAVLIKNHPALLAYHQGDPRGCALYVLRNEDVKGESVDSVYSRGIAICY